jgi:hypothetical protein
MPASVIWSPPTTDDLVAGAAYLESVPDLRVTAVLPEALFDREDLRVSTAAQALARLVAAGRLEPVLSIPRAPVFALIQDSDLARLSSSTVTNLPPRYSWPEDALGILAGAKNVFRRRWGRDPAGLVVSAGALAGPETASFERLGFRWLVLAGGPTPPGCYGGLPVRLLRPFDLSELTPEKRRPWSVARLAAARAAADGRDVPVASVSSAADLSVVEEAWRGAVAWVVAGDLALSREWPIWPGLDAAPTDFSPWIGEPEENLAWHLLGATRRAVEEFKNSGRADVRQLDLAQREIHGAESAEYFYYFGADFDSGRDADLQLEFLATLAQVYRLMGREVPAALLQDFSSASSAPASSSDEETVFQKGPGLLRWQDAAGDDRGPGDYFYPSGPEFPSGAWDLRGFEVRDRPGHLVFRFEWAGLSNPWDAPNGFSFPMVDVYVDINGIPGAGAEKFLPGRPGLAEPRDAWEYALTVDGWGAYLYQFSPGAAPRRLTRLPVRRSGDAFQVEVPRERFRGQPDRWAFAVMVMGRDPSVERPMPAAEEPGPRQFGGAWQGTALAGTGRTAPPYLDLIVPPGQSQTRVLSVYKQGRDVVIPFLRAE